ncbi:hypothetical protein J1N35_018881 [Gossypium stocksii]|uniref:Uncharacterized protein n=1 Tax=Gossypium stocksii TaxID=47602 RepID=A0A9D3VQC8_9ROSI|nr:hypothetical protein J1N35_018881 [Gossypium stocksii]
MTNEKVDISLQVHQGTHPRRNIHEEVFKESIDKFQLQYLADERRFHLIEKGKIVDDLSPPMLKSERGKGSMLIESRPFHLHDIGELIIEPAVTWIGIKGRNEFSYYEVELKVNSCYELFQICLKSLMDNESFTQVI